MSKLDNKLTQLLQSNVGSDFSWNKGLVYEPNQFNQLSLTKQGLRLVGNSPTSSLSYDANIGDDSYLRASMRSKFLKAYWDAVIKEKGAYGLNASIPLMGGTLGFDMSKDSNKNNQYWLRYKANW